MGYFYDVVESVQFVFKLYFKKIIKLIDEKFK